MIDTATNTVVGSPIAVGGIPNAIAIVPNQPPTAELTAPTSAFGRYSRASAGLMGCVQVLEISQIPG